MVEEGEARDGVLPLWLRKHLSQSYSRGEIPPPEPTANTNVEHSQSEKLVGSNEVRKWARTGA